MGLRSFIPMEFDDVYFMRQAIREALKAYEADEVPVGAIVVSNNQIIARGHNLTEQLHDVTAHAEMQAITAASHYLGAKYLPDCTLYVTLEPCTMCAGALFGPKLAASFTERAMRSGASAPWVVSSTPKPRSPRALKQRSVAT